MNPDLSIIICTYRRASILKECLTSLFNTEKEHPVSVEIIVVDNNSGDETKSVVESFNENVSVKYVLEQKQGLSHARNRGIEESQGKWIGFLDDDVMLPDDFIHSALTFIKKTSSDGFGCCIVPWFKYGRPKWLSENFETNCSSIEGQSEIWGGAMFFRKAVFADGLRFDPKLGMTGQQMGYGEESLLIDLLKQKGYSFTMLESVKVKHLVSKRKLKLSWHLRSYFNKGVADATMEHLKKQATPTRMHLWNLLKSVVSQPIKHLPGLFSNEKSYYFQNYVMDSLRLPLYHAGKIKVSAT